MRRRICVALAFGFCGVVALVLLKHPASRPEITPQEARPAQPPLPRAFKSVVATQAVAEETTAVHTNPPPQPVAANRQAEPKLAKGQRAAHSAPNSATGPLQDPVARMALSFVGVDPLAEDYWYRAINDPSLSAHERQDLIEDLNEEGLSDPKHPALYDLPLIVNRLMIIEEIWPDALDEVNRDAFQEAYKDLVNLANLAMGRGEPVR